MKARLRVKRDEIVKANEGQILSLSSVIMADPSCHTKELDLVP